MRSPRLDAAFNLSDNANGFTARGAAGKGSWARSYRHQTRRYVAREPALFFFDWRRRIGALSQGTDPKTD